MYEKGLIRLTTPYCEEALADEHKWCDLQYDDDHGYHEMLDSRSDTKFEGEFCAYLPHSCSEWVIGGPEQIKALIEDLQALL